MPHNPLAPANPAPLQPGDMLTPKEVATEYRLAERTLANWRSLSPRKGPRFVKVGERLVRYRRADIEAFIAGDADKVA